MSRKQPARAKPKRNGNEDRPPEFEALLEVCRNLEFLPHQITGHLDEQGRDELALDREFPFHIRLFDFQSGRFRQIRSWHERLELLLPLDGTAREQMGEETVDLERGDLLVVDNLKLHNMVDFPGLNTRVIVLSFRPEFVYSLGSPSYDYSFLLPFYAKLEGSAHVLRAADELMPKVYLAIAELLHCYFRRDRRPYFQAGCKAGLLTVLYQLTRRFQSAEVLKSEFLQQQWRSERLSRLFDYLRENYAEKIGVPGAARMVHMSESQFMKFFKAASGMTFVAYVTHVRVSNALRLLSETNLTIAEIAAQVGFSDQSYFDRRFKQASGKSPREFRAVKDSEVS